MEKLTEVIITDHALEQFKKRYHIVHFEIINPPKEGYLKKIRKYFERAKEIPRPPKMGYFTFANANFTRKRPSKYYLYNGWIFVVDPRDRKKVIVTIYHQKMRNFLK